MRYTPPSVSDDWELLELVRRDRRPCSDCYADDANDKELADIFGQLRLLRAAGCPPDRDRGQPNLQKVGKHTLPVSKRKVTVHVLKAKPSRWRLYFFVLDQTLKRIIFLYAVSKKTDQRDPKDFTRCKSLLDDYDRGAWELECIFIPPR